MCSVGVAIDFIYGVIHWKELAGGAETVELAGEIDCAMAAAPAYGELPVWADGASAALPEAGEEADRAERDPLTLSLWPEGGPLDEDFVAAIPAAR